jgi:DNA-binding NarL/FixJ family response regulator
MSGKGHQPGQDFSMQATWVPGQVYLALALEKDIELVGEAADVKEAAEEVVRLMPNVALTDIVVPVMSGLGVAGEICEECPETKVLISTQCDEPEDTIVAEKTGAYGFIPKKAAGYDLITGNRRCREVLSCVLC